MRPAQLQEVQRFSVSREVIENTLLALQAYGSRRLEGLVLWLGDITPGAAHIFRAFVPEQDPVSNEDGVGYFVGGETLFRLNQALASTGLRLIAQVHSHPQEAYHSATDDRYAIVTANGGLSLVVPNFGQAPADPTAWAVYRLNNGDWVELTEQEAGSLIKVIDDK